MTRRLGDSETRRYSNFTVSRFRRFAGSLNSRRGGFTLLEILVAIAILGIAVTVVLQLFSADLRAISASGDYVAASTKADAKMRELLADDKLSEKSFSEITDDGYIMDISITDALKDRTENLQVRLLEIDLTIHWASGTKDKSLTMRTLKVVEKEI
jgi:prepilin-type N-terminal cleavage/methylation domain-containing protein